MSRAPGQDKRLIAADVATFERDWFIDMPRQTASPANYCSELLVAVISPPIFAYKEYKRAARCRRHLLIAYMPVGIGRHQHDALATGLHDYRSMTISAEREAEELASRFCLHYFGDDFVTMLPRLRYRRRARETSMFHYDGGKRHANTTHYYDAA